MIEVDFRDRVPLHAGRVKLNPVSGQPNVFDMERADEPTEEGTPINKATLDSIAHSRLTGRYYIPSVEYAIASSRQGVTASPIPTSGWVYDANNVERATSGVYAIESESSNGSGWRVDGAFTSTGWQNVGSRNSWFKIYIPVAIKVRAVKFTLAAQYTSYLQSFVIQGSNNGTTWTDLKTVTSFTYNSLMTYDLTTTGDYFYYRVYFTSNDSNRITVRNFAFSLYDVNTYANKFILSSGVPAYYTTEQRLLIKTPSNVNTFAVNSNTLNGITVNTVLQPSTRYELLYNGSSFTAKVV